MWTFVILHSRSVFMFSCAQLQKSDLGRHVAAFWFHMSSETMVPARRHIPLPPPQTHVSLPPPALHHCEFPPYLCLCLMGSPCFGSIADVVQSHGGVFMDSSYPSSPVTGPLSRGQRRASEVSIASQVSGMADSYTASNIANSKCSQHQPASFSLFLALTQTLVVILLPPSFSPPYFSPYFLSFFPTLLLHLLSQTPPPHRYSDSTHTPRHSWSSLLGLIDVNSPLLFFLLLLLSPTRHLHL